MGCNDSTEVQPDLGISFSLIYVPGEHDMEDREAEESENDPCEHDMEHSEAEASENDPG